MARTAVPVTQLVSGFTAQPAGTAADPTNDHIIAPGSTPIEELVIEITQTDASARVATLVAGVSPPALSAGQGNLDQSMAQNEVWLISGAESARFVQSDGSLHIDLAASFAGTIRALAVAR